MAGDVISCYSIVNINFVECGGSVIDLELNNDEAERSILGIMLIDTNKILPIIVMLDSNDFFSPGHRLIYKAIETLYRDGKAIDIVTVSEFLRFNEELETAGGREYISSLAENVITLANYKNYCKIILKYSKKRKLKALLQETLEELNSQDVDDTAQSLKLQIEEIIINRTSDNLTHILNGVEPVVSQIDAILNSENNILGLPTGLASLDQWLSGLVGGRLYIIGARPAMGKSALAQQIAEHVASVPNKNVVFASLEMSTEEYTQRALFRRCGINQEMLTRGMVNKDTIFETVYKESEAIANENLYIIDNAECTLSEVENGIVNCINKKGSCDLVVVDYLQLMANDNRRETDDYKTVSYNSTGLKKLARKYDVPVLALCQLSRSLEARADKRPILSDLRESGKIEQDADVVMFLYREEVYSPTPMNKGMAELIVAKQRQGRTGTIDLVFNAGRTEFRERITNEGRR